MDPRVKMSQAELQEQLTLSQQLSERAGWSRANRKNLRLVSRAVDEIKGAVAPEKRRGKIECTEQQIKGAGTSKPATGCDSFSARSGFGQGFVRGNSRRRRCAHRSRQSSGKRCPGPGERELTKRWKEIVAQEVPALDQELQAAGLPRLSLAK